MKKVFYSLFAFVLVLGVTSCSSDDDNNSPTPTDVTNTVTSGSWRVTNFTEDTVDHTGYFTGYDFTFTTANVLTASNGTNTYNGVWSVTSDDEDDDNPSGDLDFNILFGSPDNFTELNEDWEILERTSTKLRLKHTSGGDGSVDLLTFEKNN